MTNHTDTSRDADLSAAFFGVHVLSHTFGYPTPCDNCLQDATHLLTVRVNSIAVLARVCDRCAEGALTQKEK